MSVLFAGFNPLIYPKKKKKTIAGFISLLVLEIIFNFMLIFIISILIIFNIDYTFSSMVR